MMTNEATSALLEVAWGYIKSDHSVPVHVLVDLHEAARCDSIAHTLRNQVSRLLNLCEKHAS